MTLWLVRHAQPLIAPGTCYGVTDVAADAADTERAAQALASVLPHALQGVSSPLQRCLQLSRSLMRLRPDISLTTDPRLCEMDFGCWEGVAWNAIGSAAMDAWTADFAQHRFGGKQSVSEFMAQVAAPWDAAHLSGQEGVWITHAGVIRACSLLQQGVRTVDRADQWPVHAPAFGEYMVLKNRRVA
jgi:alpha-ribazole phosphatase